MEKSIEQLEKELKLFKDELNNNTVFDNFGKIFILENLIEECEKEIKQKEKNEI